MAVLKPRNRLVYFRVSEDEFRQFVQLCEREGARSISDLARDAMHRLLIDCDTGGEKVHQIKLLDKLIAEVTTQLQQLTVLCRNKGGMADEASSLVAPMQSNGQLSSNSASTRGD